MCGPEHKGPEISSTNKEKLALGRRKPKLDSARKLSVIYFIDLEALGYENKFRTSDYL